LFCSFRPAGAPQLIGTAATTVSSGKLDYVPDRTAARRTDGGCYTRPPVDALAEPVSSGNGSIWEAGESLRRVPVLDATRTVVCSGAALATMRTD